MNLPDPTADLAPHGRSWWRKCVAHMRAYLHHQDPLAEASSDAAVLIGTHLPFWPLYLLWSAGLKTLPSSLVTMTLAPVFCAIPMLMRRHARAGRCMTVLVGVANTVLVTWVLGKNTGTELFLLPCVALAAISFRRAERWRMLALAMIPLVAWYLLRDHAPTPLSEYEGADRRSIFTLNAVSVIVLIAAFGWIQTGTYQRMEQGGRVQR